MKKTLVGVLAALMVLTMGTTVFASTSPNANDATSSQLKEAVTSIQSTGSAQVYADAVQADNVTEANTQAKAMAEDATLLAAVDLTYAGSVPTAGVQIKLAVSSIKSGDKLVVLHKKAGGWEKIQPDQVGNGYVIFTMKSFSPVAIAKVPGSTTVSYDQTAAASVDPALKDTSDGGGSSPTPVVNNYYTSPVNVTMNPSNNQTNSQSVSGGNGANSATSPKTGAGMPVLPAIALFSTLGIAFCGKKMHNL